jgi:hypothetical protein
MKEVLRVSLVSQFLRFKCSYFLSENDVISKFNGCIDFSLLLLSVDTPYSLVLTKNKWGPILY